MDNSEDRPPLGARIAGALDRIESIYLKVLRAAVLIVATMLLVWALAWAALSLVRISRSPNSVIVASSAVSSTELLDPQVARAAAVSTPDTGNTAEQRRFYDEFVKRYHGLYRTRFEPQLRRDDKRLSRGEFDDLTIDTGGRLSAIREGRLDFATDRADLEAFLPVVAAASAAKATADKLAQYRTARKERVVSRVQRTRTETRRGWDSLSTNCAYWYESPIGCAVTRRVEVPYTQRVTSTRYPNGISSPNEVLKSYQDRYFSLLAERRRGNAAMADAEREEITLGRITGWAGLSQSVLVAGAFLALMFFFLLVAIERHQRRLSISLLPSRV